MHRILLISDYRKGERVGKILYIHGENSSDITAYFYANHCDFNNPKIRSHYTKNAMVDQLLFAGEISVTVSGYLHHIEVESDYRRCGIGLKLLQLAKMHVNLSYIACVKDSACYEYCLTDEGEQLVVAAVRKGIIDRSMCDFNTSVGFDDPGLLSLQIGQALENKENRYPNNPPPARTAKIQTLAPTLSVKKAHSSQGLITLDKFFLIKTEIPLEDCLNNSIKRRKTL